MTDKEQREIVNPDDWKENFWGHYYKVYVSEFNTMYVNAGHAQAAIDFIVDYCLEKFYDGLLLNQAEVAELEKDGYLNDYVSGGNEGRYLSFMSVMIEEIDV